MDATLFLVRVDALKYAHRPRWAFDGAHRHSFAVPTDKQGEEDTDPARYHFYEVAEVDIDVALRDLTARFPGIEIAVYAPLKVAVRPPGDLTVKTISKSGILPT